jgi:division protein CdvB (Snf7/Vps24/ESCRT-III family)
MAKKTADSLSEQFAKRASVASEAFQKRLQAIAEEITGQLEKKLAAMTETAVTRISNEAQAIIARETSVNLIQALRKRLDQLANSLNG